MSDKKLFTADEEKELRQAMKNGGIFLKLFADPSSNVQVQVADGNGGWKTLKTLNRIISSKIYALYNEQSIYKAPLNAGYRQVSISWFIATYC